LCVGFVAQFLHEAGYEVVFIDVMDSIIESLQKTKSYKVIEISEEGEHVTEISNYRAINSKTNEAEVIDEIASADIVTCAVGPNILKFIAPVIGKGINKRSAENPLTVIACENAINATNTLRDFIEKSLDDVTKTDIANKAEFANSAVDRIVPMQDSDIGMDVKIEKFYEWCVESGPFKKRGPPKIDAIHWVDDLGPFIERKLYTVNTGHATAAYYGYNRKKEYIHEVMADPELLKIVKDTLKETSEYLVLKDGVDRKDQERYVDKIIKRISNPVLKDVVTRVGRQPLRKLSRNERFIGPASYLAEQKLPMDSLLGGIEMALSFGNVVDDEESKKLVEILDSKSAKDVTLEITGLEKDHPLFRHVSSLVKKAQDSRSTSGV